MKVVGIRFQKAAEIYLFDPGELELAVGERVVAATKAGLELGVVSFLREVELEKGETLGKVIRKALPEDEERERQLLAKAQQHLIQAREEVGRHDLPMKLVQARFTLDGKRLTIDFSSSKRLSPRTVAGKLAKRWRCQVRFHQIGPRDEVKIIGGLGVCGREACCSCWLYKLKPISLKMATKQGLPPHVEKLTGPCGRLLCCLAFELEGYQNGLTARGETETTGDNSPDSDKG